MRVSLPPNSRRRPSTCGAPPTHWTQPGQAGDVREKEDSPVYQDWVRTWGVEEAARLWEVSSVSGGSDSRIADAHMLSGQE